jgi:hypothetical protein
MGNKEDFQSEGFTYFTQTEGKKSVEIMGEKKELQYKANCFINKANTIGYAEVDLDESVQVAFISRTSSGTIITLTGEQTGPLPLNVDGLHMIMSVLKDTPIENICAEHKKAFNGEPPIQDEAWVKTQTINLPLTAIDIAMAFVKTFMESFEQVAEKMGEALGEVANGIGQAMGQAMDGLSEGMPQVTTADAGTISKKPKARKAKPKPKPKKKAPAKKAPSKKKAKPAKKGKAGKKKK